MTSLRFICAQCAKQLLSNLHVRSTCRPKYPFSRNLDDSLYFSVAANQRIKQKGVLISRTNLLNQTLRLFSQNAEHMPDADLIRSDGHILDASVGCSTKLTTSPTDNEFDNSKDIQSVFSVIAANLDNMTAGDVCLSVNKLWECMWHLRDSVTLWLECSDVIKNHELLPQLCNLVIRHVAALTTMEALNIMYLLLKFGVVHVTLEAICTLYHHVSPRMSSFSLTEIAMFVRCLQSVKNIIPSLSDEHSEEWNSTICHALVCINRLFQGDCEQQPEVLSRLVLALLHCNVEVTEPAICNIIQKLCPAIPELETSQLAPLSKAIFMMNRHHSTLAGHVTARLSDILDSITSPSDFSHIMFTVIHLASGEFQKRLANAFFRLFVEGASYGFNDLRRIMQGAVLMNSREVRDRILDRVCQLLVPQVPAMPPIELAITYNVLRKAYSTDYGLRRVLEKWMYTVLNTCDAPHQLVAVIEALSYDPLPDQRQVLINKAVDIIPQLSADRLSRLCSAAGRMRIRSGRLAFAIEMHIEENVDKLTDLLVIKSTTQFLASIRSCNTKLMSILIERLHTSLVNAVTPGVLVFALDALSNLKVPPQDINPAIWDRLQTIMPRLNGNDLRRVFFVLVSYSNHLYPSHSKLPEGLVKLLEYVRRSVYSPSILINTDGKQVDRNPDASSARATYSNGVLDSSWVQDTSKAVAFAKLLLQNRIYNESFLAAITSSVQDKMAELSPFHVRDILEVFTFGNYQPSHQNMLHNLCETRVMPYASDLRAQRLISVALNLAALLCFPPALIRTIFSLDFLKSMEELPVSRYLLSQLQDLNRAICLECPELRVPWFSLEYIPKLVNNSFAGLRLDIESVLQEILGGPTFLRCNIQTPYAYTVDFECILDSRGRPLECGDYGSVRNAAVNQWDMAIKCDPPSSEGQPTWGRHSRQLPLNVRRVAWDILLVGDLCSNVNRVSGWVEMKRRHLEILGYEYITIPYTDWSRDLLMTHQAKKLYLIDLLNGNLASHVADDMTHDGKARPRTIKGSDDMVQKILEDWGEEE